MITIPKRPNEKTRMKAALNVAKRLKEQADVDGDVSEIAADIVQHCSYGDGYEMAKSLERHGWDCDLNIAEILDGFTGEVDAAHQQFLREFQKENNIEPPFSINTKVKTKRGDTGLIDGIYEYRPFSYTIKVDGDAEADGPHKRRTIVWWDDVEAA